ncbi:hypothetical protein GCM10028805_26110 [Spirosoma harenae]
MKPLLVTLCLLLSIKTLQAQPIVLSNRNQTYLLIKNSTTLEIEPEKVTIDSLINHPDRYQFVPANASTKTTSPNKERWYRFEVRSTLQTAVCLFSDQLLPSPATLYLVYNKQLDKEYSLGKEDEKLESTYTLQVRKVWPLFFQPNKNYLVYWRSVDLPKSIVISPLDHLLSQSHIDDLFGGFYYGFVLIIILYNLLLFARLRDLDHLMYSTWVGLSAFIYGIQLGYFYDWIPTFYFGFFSKHLLIVYFLTASAHILFGLSLLHVRQLSKKMYWLGVGLISLMSFIGLAEILFALLTKDQRSFLGFFSFLIDIIFTIIAGTLALQKGFKPAWYYLLGLLLIFIGVLINVLKFAEQLPLNFLTQNSLLLGSIAEIILFTLALSYKVDLLKQQREAAIAN